MIPVSSANIVLYVQGGKEKDHRGKAPLAPSDPPPMTFLLEHTVAIKYTVARPEETVRLVRPEPDQ